MVAMTTPVIIPGAPLGLLAAPALGPAKGVFPERSSSAEVRAGIVPASGTTGSSGATTGGRCSPNVPSSQPPRPRRPGLRPASRCPAAGDGTDFATAALPLLHASGNFLPRLRPNSSPAPLRIWESLQAESGTDAQGPSDGLRKNSHPSRSWGS